ncbi:DEAD/DEAH box helicase [Kitasatospora sp. NPDC050467]|uniref:DEAD/DEAH box helicase n=1 Tax=Kitasatospora sp. NPDC050467 TaxID=3364053 RepID=UPI00379A9E47
MHEQDIETTEPTVPQLVEQRWGSALPAEGLLLRFTEPGWSYQEQVPRPCPDCGEALHSLRRPYEAGGRQYRYVAVVCPACPRAYTLAELGVKTYDKLLRPAAPASDPVPAQRTVTVRTAARIMAGLEPCDLPEGTGPGVTVTPITVWRPPGATARPTPAPDWPEDLPRPTQPETRALWWGKVTDPARPLPEAALRAADDARVILPAGEDFDALGRELTALGAQVRRAAHWAEAEHVATVSDLGGRTDLVAWPAGSVTPAAGPAAHAARDAFAAQWDALDDLPADDEDAFVPVEALVPEAWAGLLPHPTFNPVQAAAVPALLDGDEHVMVVAPTGAGKTAIGVVAALTACERGRKAAWLVPQRSLTDELDRDLDAWRRAGRRVVRLTGEAAVDTDLIREADLWVATTEKFEAICRTSSLRAALAEVGCLVVDEIHLLGDPTRGPVLEALLARVREDAARVRIVGLSATVANAEETAAWLNARLIRSPWRPTRLTWQLPALPPDADAPDWATRNQTRTREAVRLARRHGADGGSVLVFCGSKRSVRTTALALAHDRGVDTAGVDADDVDLVERLCSKAGVQLHYRDWPFKREAEHGFRTRGADVLVATSTVAAGVNLPARAVIVRDTQIGLDRIEVSMVQQMFGRAGRIGAGEREGFAHLLTAPGERHHWQARLAAGYTVTSRIRDRLSDHLLAEAVQGRIATLAQAEQWWTRTFAFHQGQHPFDPLYDATEFLTATGYLSRAETAEAAEAAETAEGDAGLAATELGKLTSRFMVEAELAAALAEAAHALPVPDDPETAEDALIAILATRLPALEQAPFTERAKRALFQVLRTAGRPDAPEQPGDEAAEDAKPVAGDLARAVLLLVAHSPQAFRGRSAYVLGIPTDSMTPVLEEAQRYLAWLGAQGHLGTVHPWIATVAADLAQRIRWRTLGPRRGAGRLLWMCEQMATPAHTTALVPAMWKAARARGLDSPDWSGTTPPGSCRLSAGDYQGLLAARATRTTITLHAGHAEVHAPRGATVLIWNGAATARHTGTGTTVELTYPAPAPDDPAAGRTGAAVFTRGDHTAGGWAAAYRTIS